MPLLFLPLLGFVIFIIAAGWGFNALAHRVGSDVAIATYFLVLAIGSAVPIAWLRRRRRRAVSPDGQTLVSRTFTGLQSSVVIDARERAVTLTAEGRTQRFAIADLREWTVFERTIDSRITAPNQRERVGSLAGVAFRTNDPSHASWSVPLASVEQARECVTLLKQLKA